jgi:hypothetical protein
MLGRAEKEKDHHIEARSLDPRDTFGCYLPFELLKNWCMETSTIKHLGK